MCAGPGRDWDQWAKMSGRFPAEQIELRAGGQEVEAGFRAGPAAPRAAAAPPASPTARAGRGRRRRRRRAAPSVSSTAPQSEVCCCLEISTPSRSRHRSLQPVPVGEGAHQLGGDLGAADRRHGDAEALLQHRHVEAREMHQLGHRRVGQQPRSGCGQFGPRPPKAGGMICTRWARPSPAESCTRHSRSRRGSSPIVSVSTATTGPRSTVRPAGRAGAAGWCRWP